MVESLKLAVERALPYWNDVIVPEIKVLWRKFVEKLEHLCNV
jgi:bisphosphoglycerate-dependent phosphoglycerate mutase